MIKSNPQAYAYAAYMTKQGQAKAEGHGRIGHTGIKSFKGEM